MKQSRRMKVKSIFTKSQRNTCRFVESLLKQWQYPWCTINAPVAFACLKLNHVFEKVSQGNAADAVGVYTKISRGKKSLYILTNRELEMFSLIATAIDK